MLNIDHVNQYRFNKLNVSNSTKWDKENIDELVDSILALHAARIGKPYISLVNKGIKNSVQEIYDYINFSNKYAYVRCMRKTLHLCNVRDLEMLHYSTRNIRISKKFEREEKIIIENTGRYITEILGKKSMIPETMYMSIINTFNTDQEMARKLVKYHWENGLLALNNESPFFEHENRTFQLTSSKYGIELVNDYNEQFYINKMIKKYLHCFAPVSFEDIVWWTGVSKTKVSNALKEYEKQLVKFTIKDVIFPLYIFETQWDALNAFDNTEDWCRFMGFEDCAMKGYMQTRFFYGYDYQRYFNSIGELLPTIVYNGKCVGIWSVDLKKKLLKYNIHNCNYLQKKLIKQEAERTKEKILGS